MIFTTLFTTIIWLFVTFLTSPEPKEILDNLNWSRGIKWTPYRRALMNHPNIYDVNGSTPHYCWKE